MGFAYSQRERSYRPDQYRSIGEGENRHIAKARTLVYAEVLWADALPSLRKDEQVAHARAKSIGNPDQRHERDIQLPGLDFL